MGTNTLLTLHGVGLLGPGLTSWTDARSLLGCGGTPADLPTVVPVPQRLPAAERRRAGTAIKVALAVADAACADAQADPQRLATVFASSSGDGANCHALCEMLAGPDRLISPTRFTNSVHNAAAGYWHIAVASRAPSTSLCAFDASLTAGLIEACMQLTPGADPLLLVGSDTPYPEPLHTTRPLPDSFGIALVLGPADSPSLPAQARLRLDLVPASGDRPTTPCRHPRLDTLRRQIPAARLLPLLEALAAGRDDPVLIEVRPGLHLRIQVEPT